MGSLAKVHLHFVDDVEAFFGHIRLESPEVKIWTADLGGNHSGFPSTAPSFLVLGNEGSGISPAIRDLADASITIPGAESRAAESLNVAASAAILLANWFGMKSNSNDE
jgi:TrmH family RNA methyltransferase